MPKRLGIVERFSCGFYAVTGARRRTQVVCRQGHANVPSPHGYECPIRVVRSCQAPGVGREVSVVSFLLSASHICFPSELSMIDGPVLEHEQMYRICPAPSRGTSGPRSGVRNQVSAISFQLSVRSAPTPGQTRSRRLDVAPPTVYVACCRTVGEMQTRTVSLDDVSLTLLDTLGGPHEWPAARTRSMRHYTIDPPVKGAGRISAALVRADP